MKAMRIGINLAAFALVVGFGLRPKPACATEGCEGGVQWSSGCSSLCQNGWCGANMPIGALQCNDGIEECNECPSDDTKVRMNCLAFDT
jgi:hypothetical protein